MKNPNVLAVSKRIVTLAAAMSVGAHLLALFGTPAFHLGWQEEPVAHIDAVLRELPPPPKLAQAASPRPVKPRQPPAPAAETLQPLPEELARADESEPNQAEPEELASAESEVPDTAGSSDVGSEAEMREPGIERARYPIRHLRLVYDLHYGENGIRIGQVVHTWSSDEERYRVESVAEATGFFSAIYGGKFVQRASGSFGPHGLIPAEYVLERGGPEKAETAHFDWQQARLTLARRGESDVVELPADVHDVLSMMHQLYFMQPLSASTALKVATTRKIGTHVYQVAGETELETPVGTLAAVHIKRVSDDGDRMELWLDPKHAMVPLRVLVVDSKGTTLDQQIRSIDADAAAAASVALRQ